MTKTQTIARRWEAKCGETHFEPAYFYNQPFQDVGHLLAVVKIMGSYLHEIATGGSAAAMRATQALEEVARIDDVVE